MIEGGCERREGSVQRTVRLLRRLGLLGAAVMLGVVALGGAVLLDARADAWSRARQASANLVSALERDVARNLAAYDLSMQGVVEALRLPGLDGASPEVRRAALFDRAATASHLGSLVLLDTSGGVVEASADDVPPGVDFSTADYVLIHQELADAGLFVGRPVRGRLRGGEAGLPLSRRVEAPDGGFDGVVAGILKLTYFRELFDVLDLGPGGSAALTHIDGRLIARHPHRDDDLGRDVSRGPAFRRFLDTGESSFVATASVDGIERLYSFRRVEGLPLVLSVAQSTEYAFSAWRRRAWAVGGALATLCAALAVLCLLFRREVLRRLAAEASLAEAAEDLAVAARTDGLTGLANRRRFDEALDHEWRRAAREGTELSLVLLDVDRFKAFNDLLGHQAGDDGLRAVAGALAKLARRPADLAARYGGEEMAMLLPSTGGEGAARVAEDARAAVERLGVPHAGNPPCGVLTASFGVATAAPMPGSDVQVGTRALLLAADASLYRAKAAGRNRVEVTAPAQGESPSSVAPSPRPLIVDQDATAPAGRD